MNRVILLALVVLAGCTPEGAPVYGSDPETRNKIFERCLEKVPAGPQVTRYNDWAEVVGACDNAAYYQSKRVCVRNCPQ